MTNRPPSAMPLASAFFIQLFLLLLDAPTCGAQQTKTSIISPDPKIQAIISRVIDEYAKDQEHEDFRKALKMLDELAIKSPEILVPQLIYYSLHARNEKEAVGIMGVMGHLGTKVGYAMRQGLIPLLETSDKKTLEAVYGWLLGIDGHERPNEESNVMFYRKSLFSQKQAPPPGLVNYVYRLTPSKALLLFGEIDSEKPKVGEFPRDLMWSDHVVTTVKWRLRNLFLQEGDLVQVRKELDTLSKHKGWYARRYVVEVMRENPKLGTPEIAERLKKDANPLVSEAAKHLK